MLKTMIGAIGCLVALLASTAAPAQETPFKPIAIVNDSAITGFDLIQREQLIIALGGKPRSKEELRSAAMDQLIEDRLKIQEAQRGGLTVSGADIDAGLDLNAKQGGLTGDELRARLNKSGVTNVAIDDMVKAALLWRDMIRSRYGARVDPSDAEVDAEIALMQQRAATSYHLAEIGLPLQESGRNEAQTRALAAQLSQSLNNGGDFAAAARKYSRAPSASKGGDIGWVPAERMPAAMAEAIIDLQPGQVTPAIPVPGGLSILKVVETKSETGAGVDPANPELRETVRKDLQNQQIERLAEGLLQELRRDALIEMR